MKIDLPINDVLTRSFRTVVSAEIVDVAPHLAGVATFAVHKCAWLPGRWKVTNVETGGYVQDAFPSKQRALAEVIAALAKRTPDDAVEAYLRLPEWVRK